MDDFRRHRIVTISKGFTVIKSIGMNIIRTLYILVLESPCTFLFNRLLLRLPGHMTHIARNAMRISDLGGLTRGPRDEWWHKKRGMGTGAYTTLTCQLPRLWDGLSLLGVSDCH